MARILNSKEAHRKRCEVKAGFMRQVVVSGTWGMGSNWLGWRQHGSQGMDGVTSWAWFSDSRARGQSRECGRSMENKSWIARWGQMVGEGLWDSSKGLRVPVIETGGLSRKMLNMVLRLACIFLSEWGKWSIQQICQWNNIFVVSVAYFYEV